MTSAKARISVAAIALGFAIIRAIMCAGYVFSGDTIMYARFLRAITVNRLITAAFASVALVVSVPVLWRGTWRQILLAVMVILLAALVLVFTYARLA